MVDIISWELNMLMRAKKFNPSIYNDESCLHEVTARPFREARNHPFDLYPEGT